MPPKKCKAPKKRAAPKRRVCRRRQQPLNVIVPQAPQRRRVGQVQFVPRQNAISLSKVREIIAAQKAKEQAARKELSALRRELNPKKKCRKVCKKKKGKKGKKKTAKQKAAAAKKKGTGTCSLPRLGLSARAAGRY